MLPGDQFRIFLCTCADPREAERIARALVEARLAACVNLLSEMQSIYRWKGEVESAKEILLVGKTRAKLMGKVEETIASLHSYDVPEIVAFEITESSAPYLRWMEENLS